MLRRMRSRTVAREPSQPGVRLARASARARSAVAEEGADSGAMGPGEGGGASGMANGRMRISRGRMIQVPTLSWTSRRKPASLVAGAMERSRR